MKTATLLADEVAHNELGEPFRTDTAVYRLDPPLMIRDGIADYVVASTIDEWIPTSYGQRRLYDTNLFVSDEEGMVSDWDELHGSGNNRNHAEALAGAGYTIVAAPVGANA
ncbi:hypothetical protein [Nocardia sp. NPDC060249]|uniref:hypothetical protein n=1 Tax=Nocardia sp. NPDC060249 TaxID=3347082 RepID=UPI00365E7E85